MIKLDNSTKIGRKHDVNVSQYFCQRNSIIIYIRLLWCKEGKIDVYKKNYL